MDSDSEIKDPDYDPFLNIVSGVTTPYYPQYTPNKEKIKVNTKKYGKYSSKNQEKYIYNASDLSPTKTKASSIKGKLS